jgi:structural maintenance of chromosome 1
MGVAREICYNKGQEVKAVTLEGTVIHKSGLITGGQGASGGRKFNDQEVDSELHDTFGMHARVS